MHQFVVRVGDYGGYMIFETDRPEDIHYFTSVFAVFEFKVEPVLDVMDAVAVELRSHRIPQEKRSLAAQRSGPLLSFQGDCLAIVLPRSELNFRLELALSGRRRLRR